MRIRVVAALVLALAITAVSFALFREPDLPELLPVEPERYAGGPAHALARSLARDPELLLEPRPEPRVYITARNQGLRVAERWATGRDWRQALLSGAQSLLSEGGTTIEADTLEVCLPYNVRWLRLRADSQAMGNVHRGVRGIMLRLEAPSPDSRDDAGRERWACPTEMIAENRDFAKIEKLFRSKHGIDREDYTSEVSGKRFGAHQLLISIADGKVSRMHRGNRLVPMSDVDREHVQALTDGMADWMVRQVHDDGRMTYIYYPSRGEEPKRLNNMIRQYMASIALVRLAKARKSSEIEALAKKNIAYNFDHFFVSHGELGTITFRGKSKLGAAALAALSIVEAPFRAEFERFETALLRTVEHLQQSDGSFHTFYGSTRRDNQNFYPGEALLLWSILLEQEQDDALMERFMRSFRYYREWHRENINPAFIPWHTQAYFKVWQQTKDDELADFIFEMNDFLCGFQEWDNSRYSDTRGRFYDDDRRQYGPPHASSTGVYLEGLIDAYQLAVAKQDEKRAQRYRRTIRRGMRSMMQLQFQDDIDMYYVSKRDRVRGALRTTVYDNKIRVDNVQHSMMGLLKVLEVFDRENAW